MASRTVDQEHYRFGFNGKENDNETYGNGNELDFGARFYDPRIGRWLSTDPLQNKKPDWTPYRFGFDSPISFADGTGEFEITPAFAEKYPRITAFLNNMNANYTAKSPQFKAAFRAYSEMDDNQIKTTFTEGKGPKFDFSNKYIDQAWYTVSQNTIFLQDGTADGIENWLSSPYEIDNLVGKETLEQFVYHETVHYGDWLDGEGGEWRLYNGKYVNRDGHYDIGQAFESLIYGEDNTNVIDYTVSNRRKNIIEKNPSLVEKDKRTLKMRVKSAIPNPENLFGTDWNKNKQDVLTDKKYIPLNIPEKIK